MQRARFPIKGRIFKEDYHIVEAQPKSNRQRTQLTRETFEIKEKSFETVARQRVSYKSWTQRKFYQPVTTGLPQSDIATRAMPHSACLSWDTLACIDNSAHRLSFLVLVTAATLLSGGVPYDVHESVCMCIVVVADVVISDGLDYVPGACPPPPPPPGLPPPNRTVSPIVSVLT
jgi:hypothetical protein